MLMAFVVRAVNIINHWSGYRRPSPRQPPDSDWHLRPATLTSPPPPAPFPKNRKRPLQSNLLCFWTMPPHELRPTDYPRPMAMEYSVARDAYIHQDALTEMVRPGPHGVPSNPSPSVQHSLIVL